jgi:hypothetical protein
VLRHVIKQFEMMNVHKVEKLEGRCAPVTLPPSPAPSQARNHQHKS